MKTQREWAAERRVGKLEAVQEQIAAGSLTVRQMTAKERKAHPAQPRPERGKGRRRKY